jgi:hypothetical protein
VNPETITLMGDGANSLFGNKLLLLIGIWSSIYDIGTVLPPPSYNQPFGVDTRHPSVRMAGAG